jgi:hypothetical protein
MGVTIAEIVDVPAELSTGGWHLRGDLDLETGELLHTLLGAEARLHAENTRDTADAQTLRDLGLDPYDPDGAHDALRLLLQRYVDADLAGSHHKQPVRVTVTVASDLLDGQPGAPPATACCQGRPHPGVTLEPDHVTAWSSTGSTHLGDTVWACPTLHHDLHHDRTVTLRDGRWLDACGWVT